MPSTYEQVKSFPDQVAQKVEELLEALDKAGTSHWPTVRADLRAFENAVQVQAAKTRRTVAGLLAKPKVVAFLKGEEEPPSYEDLQELADAVAEGEEATGDPEALADIKRHRTVCSSCKRTGALYCFSL
ncbi:protein B2 [rice-associated noda-like virus 2]|nr:protein B2 [rice-associated noda-like virus 2]